MDSVNLIAFSTFAAIAAFTPGPNNLMLAASGANFGVRRTIPHILGITTGFLSLVVMGSFGLSGLFALFPQILEIARVLAFVFLLYLGWKIATSAPPEGVESNATPSASGQRCCFSSLIRKHWLLLHLRSLSILANLTTSSCQPR